MLTFIGELTLPVWLPILPACLSNYPGNHPFWDTLLARGWEWQDDHWECERYVLFGPSRVDR